ncbi:MAG: type II toxin-antitoxin system death-on-curing family toxin [Mycobacteriales bacterium]
MNQPEPVDYLSVADLLEIAAGVLDEVLVRDIGLLASAAARPSTRVVGDDAYPTFAGKAAALMHSLARNHALVDGNNRLAWSAARALSLLNGRDLRYEVDGTEAFVLQVAAGTLDVHAITEWVDAHLVEAEPEL